ncbi:pyrroline-5-carboxylate reductase [uncultured Methanoregula sp.]|uniref:pyrroline-5-carboxylate reductase family protein n=1 Tax=uncultured Methanoregula sp. TaxID=1005933 RepID=UPI002AAA88BE|nr:pyrroline-5-carboxylate reductase [uncultured Methanoregula sp.]
MIRYGFIGTGSMGGMLIRQFIHSGLVKAEKITACSRQGRSAQAVAGEMGIAVKDSPRDVARDSDVLFICVRPFDVGGVIQEIRDLLSDRTLLVSVAGCVTLQNLAGWAGPGVRCVRILPSVTAEEQAGISLVAWGQGVTDADRELIFSLFSAIGNPVEIEERHFEIYGDLTSCAPALFAAMMQEFASAAVRKEGVPPALAEFLVQQTLIGTSWLLDQDDTGFEELIGRVATKGGITEEGVKVLRNRLPAVYDELLDVTLAKHELIKKQIADQGE